MVDLGKFVEKIIRGFEKIGSFFGDVFGKLFKFFADIFGELFDLLATPLNYLLEFLIGIFYFITVLFTVAMKVIMIFVACFQFVGSLIMGVIRTIGMWLGITPSGAVNLPSASSQGFEVVMDIIAPTGLITVVPMVATAFLWFGFTLKIIALFGGQVMFNFKGSDKS